MARRLIVEYGMLVENVSGSGGGRKTPPCRGDGGLGD